MDFKAMAIKKLDELIEQAIPEEERDEEELYRIKRFGKNCFEMGFELGNAARQKEV